MGIKAILFNSFAHIEKELAFKRLELLSEQVDELALKCDGCKNEKAFLDCLDCREKYCQKCLKEIHNPTVRKSHQIISLIKPSYLNNKEKQLGIKSNNKNAQGWVKMECFAFPTFKQGDQYQNLEKAYRALYQIYIKNNGIAPDNKISDIEIALKSKAYIENNKGKSKLFFSKKNVQDKKEGNIAEKEGKDQTPTPLSIGGEDLGEIDGSLSEQIQLFLELSSFNTEEKILMNRIAFLVFKRRGAKAVYDDFYRQIKILQVRDIFYGT